MHDATEYLEYFRAHTGFVITNYPAHIPLDQLVSVRDHVFVPEDKSKPQVHMATIKLKTPYISFAFANLEEQQDFLKFVNKEIKRRKFKVVSREDA